MSEFSSRMYLSSEAIVIGLPLTSLFFAATMPLHALHRINSAEAGAFAHVVCVFLVAAMLVCIWRLIGAFLLGGRAALRGASAYWWVPPLVGALLGLGISVHWWLAVDIEPSWIKDLAWGMPMLIPLLHLGFERWSGADTSPRPLPAGDGNASADRAQGNAADARAMSGGRPELHGAVSPWTGGTRHAVNSPTCSRGEGVPFA
jgi:hypothetical protein